MNSLQITTFPFRNLLCIPVRICLGLLFLRLTLSLEVVSAGDLLPAVKVGPVRRVFHNGEHNAFTDLCRFNSQLYLTFRSCPDGHMVHSTASIIILRSQDDERIGTQCTASP